MQDYFSDLLGNVTVTGSVVRLDFVRLSPTSSKDQPKMEFSHRLVMPIEGFLRSLDLQEEVKKKLIADGVITKKAVTAPKQ